MKRKILLLLFFIAIIFLFLPNGITAMAETKEEEKKLEEIIQEQLGELDLKNLQEYLNSLEGYEGENVVERLTEYIKGDAFDYENTGKELLNVLFKRSIELFPSFACITAVTLLTGIISSLKSESGGASSSSMIFLIGYASALLPLIGVLIECFQTALQGVSQMKEQMQIIFPIMLTLMSASGGALTASVCRPAVAFFSTSIVEIISSVVFPLTVTIICFSMAGNLTKELKINRFTAFFKSMNKWIIGVSISVFGLFMTLQGITSASYDGIMRRVTKYAIGNGVPIVGGFLSGGFDLAVAGSVLIKNSLGSMGIFLMVSVLFEPLTLLISASLLLRLTSAITGPFGESRISDFLGETADNLNYCTAGLLFTAFLYFLMIVLMVYTSEALF